jgi:hypothetical protein
MCTRTVFRLAILTCLVSGSVACTEANTGFGQNDDGGNDLAAGGGGDLALTGDLLVAPDLICAGPEICGDAIDNNCNGMTDEGCNGLGTWVSGVAGNDANPGTQASPVKTIAKGIANAIAIGGAQTVYVAGSHYPEKVILTEGVSLSGGWACMALPCPWTRDPVANDTAILDQDFEGVLAGDTITRATSIDGFRLQGMAGAPATAPGSSALTVRGGSPTITNNRINGGDVSNARRSAAVTILAPTSSGPGALLDSNQIKGGASSAATTGVAFDALAFPPAAPAVATVTRNKIVGGNGLSSSGVLAWTAGAATLVSRNDITAGSSTATGVGAVGSAWGIVVSSAMTIDSNRINLDQANVGGCPSASLAAGSWCGGIQSQSSTTTITNNVVLGVKSAASVAVMLTEAEKPAGAVVLNANYLDGAGSGPGSSPTTSAALVIRIGGCAACGVNAVFGNVRNDILVGGTNDNRYGVYEDTVAAKTAHPQAFDHNDLFFATAANRTDVLYSSWSGTARTDVTTLPAVNMLTSPPASANLNADPRVDGTYHLSLSPASPCIDTGTATEAPPTDFDGDPRPKPGTPVDIGPDETK